MSIDKLIDQAIALRDAKPKPAPTFTTGFIATHCAGCGERARICCGSLATWRCKSCCKSHGAHAVEHVGPTCHPKCTVGAPCRRAKCGNEGKAYAVECAVAMWALRGRELAWKESRPIDVPPADPLAAMLGAPGVCVMRGRRWL